MKAICLDLYNGPQCKEVGDLVLNRDDWVKIRIKAVGLCGSDLQKIFTINTSSYLESLILGHEFSGVVEEIGSKVKNVNIDDKVTAVPLISCNSCEPCKEDKRHLCLHLESIGRNLPGAFAEYVLVPAGNVRKISNNLSYEVAALTDLLAVAVHSYNLADSPKNKNVLIYGDGPLALSCLQVLYRENNNVTLIGKHKKNLDVAESLGAISIDSSNVSRVGENTYDCIVEAVGRRQDTTLNESIRLVKPGGKIIVTGVFERGYNGRIPFREMFYKEITMLGSNSYDWWSENNEFDVALRMLESGNIDYSSIITHVLPLEKFNEGLELIRNRNKTGAIKIVYRLER